MSNKIRFEQGSWGGWSCFVDSDNGKGDFSSVKMGNDKGIYLGQEGREKLMEAALKFLGVGLEYIVGGKQV